MHGSGSSAYSELFLKRFKISPVSTFQPDGMSMLTTGTDVVDIRRKISAKSGLKSCFGLKAMRTIAHSAHFKPFVPLAIRLNILIEENQ